ncbi:two component transcriptional regulator, LuxR family [Neorhodopirellula lusitana]|uniref:Two component transcriptional regulator, LuxR family n=1 Tax=Neorhodopirellula lusitana TaxID=445327 RepID=A0ABY1Q7A8_9BACT|nr:response regulator transcription factor [Neorhodopirellula lusitana]SMP58809.1 two component transcriptional regulator, LuxR family [Neorhodopirellula lusitana]
MKNKIKVMLVEDHPEYREVIDLALKDEPGIELINQVGSSERALQILQNQLFDTSPDLILLDLNLPGKSGIEALPSLRSSCPGAKFIVLTQSNNESDVMRAIQAGASGYLLKSSTVNQIVEAIRTVAEGGALLGSGVANYILGNLQASLPREQLRDNLSEREMEILTLIGEGQLKKEIASHLDISITTVATYIRRIYEKLDVQNAPAAIAKAYRAGILPHEPTNDPPPKGR